MMCIYVVQGWDSRTRISNLSDAAPEKEIMASDSEQCTHESRFYPASVSNNKTFVGLFLTQKIDNE